MVKCDVSIAYCDNGTIKYEKTNKGTTECDKSKVTCDLDTTQCDNGIVKCKKRN